MRNLPFIFAMIGFSCICFSQNYSSEATVAKLSLLGISALCLLYGLNKSVKAFDKEKANSKVKQYIEIVSKSIKDIDKRPEVKATLFHQMATIEASTGNHKTAINCYLKALKHGADEDTVDDQIWESFRKEFAKTQDEDYVKNYFDWVPFGAHHSEAKALLIGHYA